MKSLRKSLDVLEYVLNAEGDPRTPSAVAEACGINAVTALRIMGVLCERGYLEQVSRRAGYVPGPAVYALADRRCAYGCAVHAASAVIRETAARLDIQLNLSTMSAARRYILYHFSPVDENRVARQTAHISDFYRTATGRILLAHAPEESRRAVIAELGLPGDVWPEAATAEGLEKTLAEIRAAGKVAFTKQSRVTGVAVQVVGVAVRPAEGGVYALGSGFNAQRADVSKVLAELSAAAEKITANISTQQMTF